MRILAICTLLAIFNGCATANLNCHEECSLHGMKCVGLNISETSGSSYNWSNYSASTTSATTRGSNCSVTQEPSELNQIETNREVATQKIEANKKENKKKGFAGFLLIIASGLAAAFAISTTY